MEGVGSREQDASASAVTTLISTDAPSLVCCSQHTNTGFVQAGSKRQHTQRVPRCTESYEELRNTPTCQCQCSATQISEMIGSGSQDSALLDFGLKQRPQLRKKEKKIGTEFTEHYSSSKRFTT